MDTNNKLSTSDTIHIPLALIGLALCFLFLLQIKGASQAKDNMKWQTDNADKQMIALKENKDTNAKTIEARKATVALSENLQKKFTDMMRDLDELARASDADSKKIIETHGIKLNDPAGSAPRKPEPKADDK